jgi:hypothetical protein
LTLKIELEKLKSKQKHKLVQANSQNRKTDHGSRTLKNQHRKPAPAHDLTQATNRTQDSLQEQNTRTKNLDPWLGAVNRNRDKATHKEQHDISWP